MDRVLRVTTLEDIEMSIFRGHSGLVIVKEHSGLPSQHYHCYIKGLDTETFKKRRQKFYKGNKVFSTKIVTKPDIQLRYLFKGSSRDDLPIIIYNDIIDEKDIPSIHKQCWDEKEAKAELKKDVKKSGVGFKEELLERLEKMFPDRKRVNIATIVTQAFEMCIEQKKSPPQDFLMVSYVEYVQLFFSDESKRSCLESKIQRIQSKFDIRVYC